MFFRTNIKFLRKRTGRTQDDVSAALGMKRSTLSGYENSAESHDNHGYTQDSH